MKRFPQPREYHPENLDKYKGSFPVVARSNLEAKVFRWMDITESIVAWSSESIAIKYYNPLDKKEHRYFPDLFFIQKKDNTYRGFLVEIKPELQTKPPKQGRKKQQVYLYEAKTYIINYSKWEAAKKWCEDTAKQKGISVEFRILTENDINSLMN